MKNSTRKKIRQMEREDDLGISRNLNGKPLMSVKAYKILKICLIAAIPVVYFMCSPFLIAVMAAWAGLLFVTNSLEKSNNAGLKKELQTRFPKTDSILCILIIVLTLVCIAVSQISSATHANAFSGMSSTEITSSLKKHNSVWFAVQNVLKNFGTCMTGTRWLFQSEMHFLSGGGSDGGSPASAPPGGGGNLSSMLSDMPFSMIFESIIKAACTALLVVVIILGILSLFKLKKLGISDDNLTESERRRRLKLEEERLAKERASRNYFSIKRADFTEAEQDLLSDLAFLFDDEQEHSEEDLNGDSNDNSP